MRWLRITKAADPRCLQHTVDVSKRFVGHGLLLRHAERLRNVLMSNYVVLAADSTTRLKLPSTGFDRSTHFATLASTICLPECPPCNEDSPDKALFSNSLGEGI
ncbi:hypothetical protein ON010_g8386 [Phytophthora cinnamomi]|nr:hypothetical protein ON010_g8386 [Phytophthora cinnamomi]